MDKLLLWVSVLASLPEAFAQKDLSRKVFVFPRESSTDHLNLITKLEKALQNFTLCFQVYSGLSCGYSLFSYNTQGKDELLIFKDRIGEYSLYIGRTKVTARVIEEFPTALHICTNWESSTGIAEFWVNGKPLVKNGLRQGYSVGANPKIVLGQEQDSYGGGFDKTQSFMGEIGDLYTWDSLLSPEEIQFVYQGSYSLNPTILDWHALNYEMKGYVVIKPLVWG
ncbi:serum amyloid P-component [Physeter macrocephalus]|uniref:Pentraxin family member n=1 Tax=Physeter macrocephalus TaxID=9755 RepID=A0A2Y9FJY7_PHYMC|nr:serum amyloid P-component [Physeter catodon]|eukprot:XP_007123446.2 serum amyloid P-component [Physeter catodon]